MRAWLGPALLALAASGAVGRDWYVDQSVGDDAAAGEQAAPLRTIAKGIRSAQPGDTVHLVPGGRPYHEPVAFFNKSGEPGRPIIVDGHGATISGAVPLDPKVWEAMGGGLYRCAKLIKPDDAIVQRFFFLFEGRTNRMGRSLKGPKEPYREPGALKPGEWTWVAAEQAFYLKVAPARPLAECSVEAPLLSSGVAVAGACEHLVIRNLTVTHVHNDGFNIHGATRDVRFENVRAIECGDDGISAHDDCEITVDGMVSVGNSTGVCHAGTSRTVSRRMVIAGNHGYDYYVLETGSHELRDSVIVADAAQSVVVYGPKDPPGACRLKLDNVLVQGSGKSVVLKFYAHSVVEATRCTFSGLSPIIAGDSFTLRRSVVAGEPEPYLMIYAHAAWQAEANLYDLQYLRVGDRFHQADRFTAYQQASGQDAGSRWSKVQFAVPFDGRVVEPAAGEAGVDPARLPPLPEARGGR